MSTTLLNESFNPLNIQYDKRIIVSIGREELAVLVQRRMQELNLSTNAVAKKSGNKISNGTVWNIANSRVRDVKEETLRALARGLDLSEEEVFAAYFGKSVEPMSPQDFYSALEAMGVENFHSYGGIHNLSADDQQEIIAMVSTLVEQKLKRKQASGKAKDKK